MTVVLCENLFHGLVILRFQLEVALRVVADGAHFRGLGADMLSKSFWNSLNSVYLCID